MTTLVDKKQATKAVQALLRHAAVAEKEQQRETGNDLLGDEEDFFYLVVALTKIHAKNKPTPERIMRNEANVCLVCKDPESEFKALVEAKNLSGVIDKVISVSNLRKEYKPYEAKRQLCASYDVFLADERVVPILPKLLGKSFFQKKKLPLPINLKKTDLAGEVRAALDTTSFYQSNSASFTIKVATTRQPVQHVVDNILAVLPALMKFIPRGSSNVRMVGLKTRESLTLPLYNSVPDVQVDDADLAGENGKNKEENKSVEETTELEGTVAGDDKAAATKSKKAQHQEEREKSKKEVRHFVKTLAKRIRLKV